MTTSSLQTNTHAALDILQILAGETRLQIIQYLLHAEAEAKQVCVNEIAEAIGKTHSATSHQLARLEDKNVISGRRTGQKICYLLADNDKVTYIKRIINQLPTHE